MKYHRFNIGNLENGGDVNEWWAENVRRGVITTGFDGEPDDEGEKQLRAMDEGDRVLAYASGYGYVGAGRVLGDSTYRLHASAPLGSVSTHQHERGVRWEYVISDVRDGISEEEARLFHPIRTRLPVANAFEADHLIAILKERAVRPEVDLVTLQVDFDEAIRRSSSDSRTARQTRLKVAPKLPERITVSTYAYLRNPDVVAEVLDIAQGQCQECGKPAPFPRKSDGSPYLEVHHRVRLAEGGEDTVENAIALCPNCHRKMHYGKLD
ncbi:HNH endonuclease [Burkholderia sp. Bmkn7]|uniref:HNH endonuclease n=1 Tax=Burkholderia sp. Bmkn7 TaxID=3236841 RepID=UPI0034E40678